MPAARALSTARQPPTNQPPTNRVGLGPARTPLTDTGPPLTGPDRLVPLAPRRCDASSSARTLSVLSASQAHHALRTTRSPNPRTQPVAELTIESMINDGAGHRGDCCRDSSLASPLPADEPADELPP